MLHSAQIFSLKAGTRTHILPWLCTKCSTVLIGWLKRRMNELTFIGAPMFPILCSTRSSWRENAFKIYITDWFWGSKSFLCTVEVECRKALWNLSISFLQNFGEYWSYIKNGECWRRDGQQEPSVHVGEGRGRDSKCEDWGIQIKDAGTFLAFLRWVFIVSLNYLRRDT